MAQNNFFPYVFFGFLFFLAFYFKQKVVVLFICLPPVYPKETYEPRVPSRWVNTALCVYMYRLMHPCEQGLNIMKWKWLTKQQKMNKIYIMIADIKENTQKKLELLFVFTI